MDYIFGPEVMEDGYNVTVIRECLTRNLGPLYGDIHDEICNAFDQLIPATEDGEWFIHMSPCVTLSLSCGRTAWHAVPALRTMREIVARTSSRVFVGHPLCECGPTAVCIARLISGYFEAAMPDT